MKIQRQFSISDKLAGRKVYYHGTSKRRAESIKESGIKAKPWGEDDLRERGWDPEKFKDKVYMHEDKKYASCYAEDRGADDGDSGEVLKISIPYEKHRKMTKCANPEREYNGIAHLRTKDEFSRAHLGKPYKELNKKDKYGIKEAVKYAKSEVVFDENIPSKYIKGSKDYEPVTAKEILKYQKAKLTGDYKDYDSTTK